MGKVTIYIYYTMLFPVIYLLSSFKEESLIDGVEIRNACMAHRAFVVDDIRDFTVTLAIILLVPCFYFLQKTKFKSTSIIFLTIAVIFYSAWRFFIRITLC